MLGAPDAALSLTGLTALMTRAQGSPDLAIGLADGPVAIDHPGFAGARIQHADSHAVCATHSSIACAHGTFVAGILVASRESGAPGVCPGCTLLVQPIFSEQRAAADPGASATAERLAEAIVRCVDAGARLVNVSAAVVNLPSPRSAAALRAALDLAAHRGVLVVAAAGNQGRV